MILRSLLRLIGEVTLWTAIVVVLGLAVASVASLAGRRRPSRVLIAWTIGGALLAAGLYSRLQGSDPALIDIGRRPLPTVWAIVGAVAGAASQLVLGWRRARLRRPKEG